MIFNLKASLTLAALAALGLAAAHPAASAPIHVKNGTFSAKGSPVPDFANVYVHNSAVGNNGTYTAKGVPGGGNVGYIGYGNTIDQNLSTNGLNPGLKYVTGHKYTINFSFVQYGTSTQKLRYGFYDATKNTSASAAPHPLSTAAYTYHGSKTAIKTYSPVSFTFTAPAAANGHEIGIYFTDTSTKAAGNTTNIADVTASAAP